MKSPVHGYVTNAVASSPVTGMTEEELEHLKMVGDISPISQS